MNFEAVDEKICSLRMKGKFNNFPVILIHTLAPEEYELVTGAFMINLLRYIKEFQHTIRKL
jgi:hypothetical protein